MFSSTGTRFRLGLPVLLAMVIALLTACGAAEGDAGSRTATTTGRDSANCSGGATATSNLQPEIRRLTDGLNGLQSASQRNDLDAVLQQLDSARQAADRIGGGLSTAAAAMSTPSLIRTEFENASASGAGLRDTLDGLRAVLTGNRAQDDQSAQLQNSVTAFNTSVERLSLACSNLFSASTVEPTTTVPPSRIHH
ncbi:hypothetical protein [Nocardia sp. NPDC020380]|uniref:hypothetical protein n=1 Tax=Nocardia sp. NPDC020380 TaxID=3364309 RepID=UPI0037ACF911